MSGDDDSKRVASLTQVLEDAPDALGVADAMSSQAKRGAKRRGLPVEVFEVEARAHDDDNDDDDDFSTKRMRCEPDSVGHAVSTAAASAVEYAPTSPLFSPPGSPPLSPPVSSTTAETYRQTSPCLSRESSVEYPPTSPTPPMSAAAIAAADEERQFVSIFRSRTKAADARPRQLYVGAKEISDVIVPAHPHRLYKLDFLLVQDDMTGHVEQRLNIDFLCAFLMPLSGAAQASGVDIGSLSAVHKAGNHNLLDINVLRLVHDYMGPGANAFLRPDVKVVKSHVQMPPFPASTGCEIGNDGYLCVAHIVSSWSRPSTFLITTIARDRETKVEITPVLKSPVYWSCDFATNRVAVLHDTGTVIADMRPDGKAVKFPRFVRNHIVSRVALCDDALFVAERGQQLHYASVYKIDAHLGHVLSRTCIELVDTVMGVGVSALVANRTLGHLYLMHCHTFIVLNLHTLQLITHFEVDNGNSDAFIGYCIAVTRCGGYVCIIAPWTVSVIDARRFVCIRRHAMTGVNATMPSDQPTAAFFGDDKIYVADGMENILFALTAHIPLIIE